MRKKKEENVNQKIKQWKQGEQGGEDRDKS